MESSSYYVAQLLLAALIAAIIFILVKYYSYMCVYVHLFMRRLHGLKTPKSMSFYFASNLFVLYSYISK